MNNDQGTHLIAKLDALVEKYHLLKHPFYRAWTAGRLERDALALYTEQYYHHVRAFPEQLKSLATRTKDELRAVIEENLAEELDSVAPHPQLWRQFAAAMRVSEDRLNSAGPLPGIAALLNTYEELAEHGSPAQAVAAFYAYEAQVPEIAAQKIDGLRRYYNVEEARSLAYFAVDQKADVRHRTVWRNWLAAQPRASTIGAAAAAKRALKALWGALDSVTPAACLTD